MKTQKINDVLAPSETAKLKAETKDLRRQLREAMEQRALDETYHEFITGALKRTATFPEWVRPTASTKHHEVVPVTLCSDWHLDEVVRPEEVQFKNAYDRRIAERRFKLYIERVIKVSHEYIKSFTYPGIVVAFLGDNFSGNIHEELRNTNADKIMGSMLHWLEHFGAGLTQLADAFGRVWVVSVPGNHGRNTLKPIMKQRARDNFDWLFMRLLEREFNKTGETRIEWLISEAHKQPFSIYNTRFIASHGDEARGGSGIAGMLSPQLIAYHRMKKLYEFDIWVLGHWHYLSSYRNIRVNGSGKGFDEYAMVSNFDFQVPAQDLFLVSPENGVTASWPIFCAEKEGNGPVKYPPFKAS